MEIKVDIIDEIVEDLYYEVKSETWDKLNGLFENIAEILSLIESTENKSKSLSKDFTNLMSLVDLLSRVMDSGDRVLLIDNLIYNLKPTLKSLKANLSSGGCM